MIYIYKHPKKEKYIEVIQTMNEEHVYADSDGLQWERVYTSPQAIIKESVDCNSPQQFVEVTKKRKGTVGDLQDFSQELSEKRVHQSDTGRDPVLDKFYDSWSAKRHNKSHPDDTRPKKPPVKKEARMKYKASRKKGK